MIIRILLLLLLGIIPARAAETPQEFTTPRGISIWYQHDATTPSVAMAFAFRGGIEEDASDKQGAAFLMASLLTEGTVRLSATQFQQQLADHSVTFSITAGREALRGTLRFLLHHRDAATMLAHDALTSPAFRAADVARLQQAALAAFNSSSADPEWRVQRLAMQQLFGGTPYANAARGLPATLARLTPADMKAAAARHLTRGRLVIAVVGAADVHDTAAMVDAIFADLPQGTPWQARPLALQGAGEIVYSPWQGGAQNNIIFAAPSVAPTAPDYAAALVVNDILGGGGFRAALMDELRQNLGATYGADTDLTPMAAAPMMMGRSAVVADKTDAAIGIIKNVWRDAPRYLTPERVAASVTYLSGSLTNGLTSSSAIADYYLGLRLAHLPPDTAVRLPAQLRALTQSDILRAAATYYKPDDLSFAVVGPVTPSGAARTVSEREVVE